MWEWTVLIYSCMKPLYSTNKRTIAEGKAATEAELVT